MRKIILFVYLLFISFNIFAQPIFIDDSWTHGNNKVTLTNSTDNVGIGSANPDAKLSIFDSSSPEVNIIHTGSSASGSGGIVRVGTLDGSALNAGDRIGFYGFRGSRSSTLTSTGALISAIASEDWSGSSAPTDISFQSISTGLTTQTEKMRITATGNVGIGTWKPVDILNIKDGNLRVQQAVDTTTNGLIIAASTGVNDAGFIRRNANNAGALVIRNNATDTLYITGGNVGVGSASPGKGLDVFGTVRATAFIGDGSLLSGVSGGSSQWVTTGVGIGTTSNVGVGTTSPTKALEIYKGSIALSQIKKPTAPTLAVGAAGALNGSYKYCVSYYDSNSETRCSLTSSTVSPSSERVTVTIPTSSENIIGRKIYRTLANATSSATGHEIMYLVTTISDNSTTSYDDNNTDATIQSANIRPIWNTSNSSHTFIRDLSGTIEVSAIGVDDTIMGYQAGHTTTTGDYTGWQNTLIGAQTGSAWTSGIRSVALGYNALTNNQNGNFNAGVGVWTLYGLVSGDNNAAMNHGALENGKILWNNTSLGFYSFYNLGLKESGSSYGGRSASGQLIAALADYSGTVAGTILATTTNNHPYTTGDIVRIGGTNSYDGVYTVTVVDTTHFYFTATFYSDEGGFAESDFAGTATNSGDQVGLYYDSDVGINDRIGNICIGYYCGQKQSWGQYNTFIGYKARYENGSIGDALSYSGCIGAECHVNIDNAFVIGSDKLASSDYYGFTNVGLNTRRPIYSLTLNGTKEDSTIGVARNITTAGAAGKALNIRSGGATVNGSISALNKTPTAGGTGYRPGDILTIITGGTGATARVVETDAGVVKVVQLLNEGSGYTTGTGKSTTVSPSGGTGCTLNITTVRSSIDLSGGDLNLYSGIGSGSGNSKISMYTNPSGGSGTTDTTPTLRMIIDSGGNVGIGSVNPRGRLDLGTGIIYGDGSGLTGISGSISGLTTNMITKASSSSTIADSIISDNGSNIGIGSSIPNAQLDIVNIDSKDSLIVKDSAGDTTPFVIDSGGNVGIGTFKPETGLVISGKTVRIKGTNTLGFGDDGNASIQASATTSGFINLRTGGNTRMTIGSGNIGIGTTVPNKLLCVGSTCQASIDSSGVIQPSGYKSADGTSGVTVTTCSSFKDGLCVSGV